MPNLLPNVLNKQFKLIKKGYKYPMKYFCMKIFLKVKKSKIQTEIGNLKTSKIIQKQEIWFSIIQSGNLAFVV